LDRCRFVILLRPLWREDGSVIYCCCWASPTQSSFLSPFFRPLQPGGPGWNVTVNTSLPRELVCRVST
jgi:hypothetical protein